MWIGLNGKGQAIEHEQVSLQGRSELTFKTFADAPNRIFFDSVRIWRAECIGAHSVLIAGRRWLPDERYGED